jgi:membrane-bound lytic murein transglycosylase D
MLLASTSAIADDEVEARLRNMECLVPVKVDASVTNRISNFLRARRDSEKLIGRSATFFPIFDKYLKEYDLPADLKYVTCLETELNNRVVSTAGAKGIWQLMPDVKEEFGLRIDGTLDERLDLYRGTEAALKDFKRMYKTYGDWELVLAGYNCGVGCLGAAIKRARSKEFDEVKKYLPKQTQEYVSKFIAFSYLMKNYKSHQMKPVLPNLDMQIIGGIKVFNHLSLSTVASVTGIAYDVIKDLNQHLGEGYVPETKNGINVIVPRRVMGTFQDYITNPDVAKQANLNFTPMILDDDIPKLKDEPYYFKTTYYVGEGDTIESLADLFNVGVYNIMLWNHFDAPRVNKGQELTLYLARATKKV